MFPGHFLYRILSRNPDAWWFQNQVFAWKVLQKSTFHRNRFFKLLGSIFVDFVCFPEALGATFLIFIGLEKGLKIDGFSVVFLIPHSRLGAQIYVRLGALNNYYRPANNSFRTDDC